MNKSLKKSIIDALIKNDLNENYRPEDDDNIYYVSELLTKTLIKNFDVDRTKGTFYVRKKEDKVWKTNYFAETKEFKILKRYEGKFFARVKVKSWDKITADVFLQINNPGTASKPAILSAFTIVDNKLADVAG